MILVVLLQVLMVAGVPGMVRLKLTVPIGLTLTIALLVADQFVLKRAGVRRHSFWWILVGPIYLFLRPREVGSSVAMGVTWCGSFVAWLVVPTLLAATVGVHISTDRVAHKIQSDLERQTGLQVTVHCPPPMTVRLEHSFECTLQSGPYDAIATVTVFNQYGGYRVRTRAAPSGPADSL